MRPVAKNFQIKLQSIGRWPDIGKPRLQKGVIKVESVSFEIRNQAIPFCIKISELSSEFDEFLSRFFVREPAIGGHVGDLESDRLISN